ncbi:hypothetical protein EGW08_004529 [Elysia chlorotica]|uniref:Phosphorylase b kinase regulatory subunit n=1 Tax=Elysia chlorotica TaxID=188477 RepID=A0A433U1R8_ELYCH|nr:hypothetical protein EGW08_004529 [Elysia chlorotica]
MRSRSNSGIRLDYYQRLVNNSILKYQNCSSGLFVSTESIKVEELAQIKLEELNLKPCEEYEYFSTTNVLRSAKSKMMAGPSNQSPLTGLISGNDNNHSWVRDNVYCIMAVWGLALAYRKTVDLDEDRAKAYELEKAVVHSMRGLLRSMQMQSDKVEQFKRTQSPRDSLHAKYSSQTGKTVVGDYEWGHLQIDATSLFLLALAQMTASGVIIIFTLDEVAFIQNLVFYIEAAYRCPDYGIWERGDKTNHGLPELNASSIGMAKAALEAINELDLFGSRGGPASVIHVLPDEAQQCQAILLSMLPRESISKETDAALLTVVGFPAFAVDDPDLIALTRKTIKEKLEGPYGCCRFLRDGYKTAREDPRRLHYEPWELMVFENIECQWPLFFAYLVLDGLFSNNQEQVENYSKKLDSVLLRTEDNVPIVPELYAVPKEFVEAEYKKPNSQKRVAEGKIPHMWGQSMYILGRLMIEGFLSPGELDPLNRRHVTETKPDVVVQVVLLAEDSLIQDKMALHGIELQTVAEVAPIQIHPARVLSKLYSLLGKNRRMGLSGRASSSEIGLLATSKLYMMRNKILAFVPQFMDLQRFYVVLDTNFLVDFLRTEVAYLKHSWKALGRPIVTLKITHDLLDNYQHPPNALLATIKKLQSGYISGARVHLGRLSDFLHTSCITKLSFLRDMEDQSSRKDKVMVDQLMAQPSTSRPRLLSDSSKKVKRQASMSSTGLSVQGIVRRSRSIQVDPDDVPVQQRQTPHHLKDGVTDMAQDEPGSAKASPNSLRRSLEMENEETDVTELVEQLKQSTNLQEQADIIHYLYLHKSVTGGHWKQWWLVRHTAGMLRKRVEDLALAATDLLVRQKQLSVGLPPEHETIITSPLPPDELAAIIYDSCGEDHSTASLTQELLVYLAMFIRTEPHLFNEMLRLRVGLIVQVMASELARTLQCSGEEASDHLLNLSPFEMKTLLHHILSGKEFFSLQPLLFFFQCRGLTIKGHALSSSLTREMTKGEFKFALQVEMVLNRIPQPEYRQLMVEAMMVLTFLAQSEGSTPVLDLSHVEIEVDNIVQEANNLLIKDLVGPTLKIENMRAAADICLFLYDVAPSGRFGSMAYMCRALANILNLPRTADSALECCIS